MYNFCSMIDNLAIPRNKDLPRTNRSRTTNKQQKETLKSKIKMKKFQSPPTMNNLITSILDPSKTLSKRTLHLSFNSISFITNNPFFPL